MPKTALSQGRGSTGNADGGTYDCSLIVVQERLSVYGSTEYSFRGYATKGNVT